MKNKFNCIVCPLGCLLEVEFTGESDLRVCGNTCARGEKYARDECFNPKRTVTSTVVCNGGGVVSVKTDRAIPKDKIAECMKKINNASVDLPVCIGDIIIKDVFGSNVVATQNKEIL